jgi:hypothetical protein
MLKHVVPYSKWTRINEEEKAVLTGVTGTTGPASDPSPSGTATPIGADLASDELIGIAVNKTAISLDALLNANSQYIPYDLYSTTGEFWKPFAEVKAGTLPRPDFAKLVTGKKLTFCPPRDKKTPMDYFVWIPTDDTGNTWTLEPYTQPGFSKIAWVFKDNYWCPVPSTEEERKLDPKMGADFPQLGLGNPDNQVKTCPFSPGDWIYVKQVSTSTTPEYNGQKKVSARNLIPNYKEKLSTPTDYPKDLLILEQAFMRSSDTATSYGYAIIVKRRESSGSGGISGGNSGGGGGIEKYVAMYNAKYF